jgi:hypothetical protein
MASTRTSNFGPPIVDPRIRGVDNMLMHTNLQHNLRGVSVYTVVG